MGRAAILWLVVAGCFAPRAQPGAPCADGACPAGLVCLAATDTCELPATDARPSLDVPLAPDALDAFAPTTDALVCFGAGLASICPRVTPSAPLAIATATTIDTDASPLCVAYIGGSTPDAFCVVVGTSVSVDAAGTLVATGSRPLVVLATGTMTIDGTIDVASHRGQPPGAGANPMACVGGAAPITLQGGTGGSFAGRGGDGGGVSPNSGPGPASAPAIMEVSSLRGGCRGATGTGQAPGAGGNGGGAVLLIAASAITINGTVNASGGGGDGAMTLAGGGGGGTGGLIGLDAPSITVAAAGHVFANGGGGGEGATTHKTGRSGADPMSPMMAASAGRFGAPKGGDGGIGTAGTTLDGAVGRNGGLCDLGDVGGGGGGGGAGAIRVFPPQALTGEVSPPPI